jgi:hypothetical protein
LLILPAAAEYLFDGGLTGEGTDVFAEANWFDPLVSGDPIAGTFQPSIAVPTHPTDPRIVIGGNFAAIFGDTLAVGNNTLQICDTSSLIRSSTQRIRAGLAGTKAAAEIKDNASAQLRFSLDLDWSLFSNAVLVIGEGGDPLINSTVDFSSGFSGFLHLVGETEGATNVEHFLDNKFTVNGSPPTLGNNLFIVTNGGTDSYIFSSDGLETDIDGDGLTNSEELDIYFTEPGDADTDGDSIDDGRELDDSTSPLDPSDNNGEQGYIFIGNEAGGDGSSVFVEANWTADGDLILPHVVPPDGSIDTGVAIPALPGADENSVTFRSGTPGGANGFAPDLNLGIHELVVRQGTVLRGGTSAGIIGGGNAVLEDDSRTLVRFLSGLDVYLSDRAALIFHGPSANGLHMRDGTSVEFNSLSNQGAYVRFAADDPETVLAQSYTFSSSDGRAFLFVQDFRGGTLVTEDHSGDGDSLPDGYERAFFGDLITADNSSDYDGDGILDRIEFECGTNPVEGTLEIEELVPVLPGSVIITVRTPNPFDDYNLYRSVTLDDGFPALVAGPLPGNGELLEVVDQAPQPGSAYYRLESVTGGLHFDVDLLGSPKQTTGPGFLRMTNADGSPVGSGGPVTVVAGTGTYADRGTGAIADQPYSQLLRDFILRDPASGPLTVSVFGLPAGDYLVTTFHHDTAAWNNSNPFDVLVSDPDGIDRLVVDSAIFTPGQVPYLGARFPASSNGMDGIVITIREDEAGTTDGIRFNGLAIVPAP